jgi:hypothetical protein
MLAKTKLALAKAKLALAKAKLASSITFIVLASFTIVTYDHQNMFIIQATGGQSSYLYLIVVHFFNTCVLDICGSLRQLFSFIDV